MPKMRLVLATLFFITFILTSSSSIYALDNSTFPANLKVEWQGNGASINTPYPILTWDTPQGSTAKIDTIIVRVRKDAAMVGCLNDGKNLVEHWFTTNDSPEDACNLSSKTRTSFVKGDPPSAFVVAPDRNLQIGERYYWSVSVHADNKWVVSTGYSQGAGGNFSSEDWFTVVSSPPFRNFYGINTYVNQQYKSRKITTSPALKRNLLNQHLDWAKMVAGERGYLKLFLYGIENNTQESTQDWKDLVQGAYDRNLIPVLRLQGPWRKDKAIQPWEGYFMNPAADADSTYKSAAQAYKRVVATLPKHPTLPIFIELYNEVNYANENWGNRSGPTVAREYAQFFMDTQQALKELNDSRIKLIIGGLGRYQDVIFLREMLKAPGFAQAVVADGYWTTHIYPMQVASLILDNTDIFNPNLSGTNISNMSPLAYKFQLHELAKVGVDVSRVKVLITEGGFQATLGEEAVAEKVLKLLDYWEKDIKWIEGAALFTLDVASDPDILDLTNPKYNPGNPTSEIEQFSWVFYDSDIGSNGQPTHSRKVFRDVLARVQGKNVNSPPSVPQNAEYTTSYQVAYDNRPTDWSTVEEQEYADNVKVTHTFSTPGDKFIFVKFKTNKGREEVRQQKIVLVNPPTETTTQVPNTASAAVQPQSNTNSPLSPAQNLTAQCSSDGVVTVTWNAIPEAAAYAVRVDAEPFNDGKTPGFWSPTDLGYYKGTVHSAPSVGSKDFGANTRGNTSTTYKAQVISGLKYDVNIQGQRQGEQYPYKGQYAGVDFICGTANSPLSPAQNLTAQCSSDGVVTVTWNAIPGSVGYVIRTDAPPYNPVQWTPVTLGVYTGTTQIAPIAGSKDFGASTQGNTATTYRAKIIPGIKYNTSIQGQKQGESYPYKGIYAGVDFTCSSAPTPEYTTKYQVAYDLLPTDWSTIREYTYTGNVKVSHTFSPTSGDKFIFVKFKTNKSREEIRQLKIALVSPAPSPTAVTVAPTLVPTQAPTVAPTIVPTVKPTATPVDVYQCTSDNDCISVRADSCGCSAGGKATAINKQYVSQWNTDHPVGRCSQVMSDDWTCVSSAPKCASNKCQLVQASVASTSLSAPQGLKTQCSVPDGRSVTVSWDPVTGAGAYVLRFNKEPLNDWKNDNGGDFGYSVIDGLATSHRVAVSPNSTYQWTVQAVEPNEKYPFKGQHGSGTLRCDSSQTADSSYPTASISGPNSAAVGESLTYNVTVNTSSGFKSSDVYIAKTNGTSPTRVTNTDIAGFDANNFNCNNSTSSNCAWYRVGSSTSSTRYSATFTPTNSGNYVLIVGAQSALDQKSCGGNPYVSYPIFTGGVNYLSCGDKAVIYLGVSPR